MSTHTKRKSTMFWSCLALLLVVCSFVTVSLVLIPDGSSAQSGETIVLAGALSAVLGILGFIAAKTKIDKPTI